MSKVIDGKLITLRVSHTRDCREQLKQVKAFLENQKKTLRNSTVRHLHVS